ncbi:uncharacterized protein LOC118471686 [Amphiprion ocellaris]|uniref:uncharacterized protein LOC118471686 n=1 Tax=Amphiprion ocellaris TaxID=80972 RepID=UPI002410FEDA|nr:uncharacterized protein LOC118471686 [Amphiprion ocellaris]
MSASHPTGEIKDYFYRVEFQQRGSPHVHCLFWIENAPLIDKNTDTEVIEFIDQYVTCKLPSEDEELLEIVKSVQQHSKRHSKSCKKNKTVCRFNFPKPASMQTFISCEEKCVCHVGKKDKLVSCTCLMRKDRAAEILTKVKNALADEKSSFDSLESLFHSGGVTQGLFEKAYKCCSKETHVVLKRDINEVWVNQYNKSLKCWNANLDIHYVVDAYACVVYIISYISKAEREIGLLLGNAQREAAKDKNISARYALKNLGSVYLHNRDVCAQEAVYRLTSSMHLKECSRKVVFVPTSDNIVRMSLPLNVLKEKASSEGFSSDHIWMNNIVDRYKNRPDDSNFSDMCMAVFASEYCILSKNEKSQTRVTLKNKCGFVMKRTRTKPAVVRYMRFSETKKPEAFYQSNLQLFNPYRVDAELKLPSCETFEQFYKNGNVRFSDGSTHSVKSVVDDNRSKFEIQAEELDNIQNAVDINNIDEDAWCQLCPEQNVECLECEEECKAKGQAVEDHVENIPDLAVIGSEIAHLEKRNNIMCRSNGLALIRSLNEMRLAIFNQIRQWCLDKIAGKRPDPLHLFLTGGAGTGKSHLIKAIQYEAMRLLSATCRHPDNTCVC